MLIAISGSQGSGKTTILNEIAKLGFSVVERKTARSVMTEQFPGRTLDDIYANPTTSTLWQDAILARKIADEADARNDSKVWFTERTYADLFTYAVMAVGKNNAYSVWLDDYYDRCKLECRGYAHAFYLQGGKFNPVDDGVRGINRHYQSMIDGTLQHVSNTMMNDQYYCDFRLTQIETADIDRRVHQISTKTMEVILEHKFAKKHAARLAEQHAIDEAKNAHA